MLRLGKAGKLSSGAVSSLCGPMPIFGRNALQPDDTHNYPNPVHISIAFDRRKTDP